MSAVLSRKYLLSTHRAPLKGLILALIGILYVSSVQAQQVASVDSIHPGSLVVVVVETGPANNLLVTKETSRLDPGVVENKYYKAGIGFIRGDMVKGGEEFTELVSFTLGTGSCGP